MGCQPWLTVPLRRGLFLERRHMLLEPFSRVASYHQVSRSCVSISNLPPHQSRNRRIRLPRSRLQRSGIAIPSAGPVLSSSLIIRHGIALTPTRSEATRTYSNLNSPLLSFWLRSAVECPERYSTTKCARGCMRQSSDSTWDASQCVARHTIGSEMR